MISPGAAHAKRSEVDQIIAGSIDQRKRSDLGKIDRLANLAFVRCGSSLRDFDQSVCQLGSLRGVRVVGDQRDGRACLGNDSHQQIERLHGFTPNPVSSLATCATTPAIDVWSAVVSAVALPAWWYTWYAAEAVL